ncbi:PH domain-containing protein [uncultured Methanobrevibacter sp.]|uniref:PH domain-containing protein n=1 Tax=uncultured Methanobrevibacter sp. TaxID=253161 RepID=UPI0025E25295|nr:PH domain-containing protein [uncultured Methanobrevibacter sp.]
MFGKKDNQSNERVIYQAKPNLILGCKKAILALILLIFILCITGPIIKFIGGLQVYLISQIKLPITRYTSIALFVVILIIILYMIWQIIGWNAKEYILTDSKIIVKSGVILTRKNYMPYSTIQDVNTSQNILERLFNVGSVSVFSAYDNNQISIENVSNPSEVEEIIFNNMSRNSGYYQAPPPNSNSGYRNSQQGYYQDSQQGYYQDPQQGYYQDPQQGYYQDPQQGYYQDPQVIIRILSKVIIRILSKVIIRIPKGIIIILKVMRITMMLLLLQYNMNVINLDNMTIILKI